MLFDLGESIRSALLAIRAHGFRSFLTTLGIIIGVAAVIAMVSIIQGLSYSVNQSFEGLGSNSITVQSYTPLQEALKGHRARITPDDYDLISRRVDGITSITPVLYSQGRMQSLIGYGSQSSSADLYGSTYSFQDVQQYYMHHGRFLSVSDDLTRRRVAVIGEELRKNLSLPKNPVGEYISIGEEWVKIIGLTETKGQLFGMSQDNFVALPYSTMRSLNGNQIQPDIRILLTINNVDETELIKQRIRRLLRQNHGLTTEDDDFRIQTAEQLADTVNSILGSVTIVMGGIVGISLLVGGIGIMNIMLVSVTERTREIGICKAIGAKRYQILLQFLFESSFLCIIGGLIGLGIGYGLGYAASSMIPDFPSAYVPFWAVLLAIGFSAFVGILFGIVPAAKAANLDPIDALRYE